MCAQCATYATEEDLADTIGIDEDGESVTLEEVVKQGGIGTVYAATFRNQRVRKFSFSRFSFPPPFDLSFSTFLFSCSWP
jgi:hypothetical protein